MLEEKLNTKTNHYEFHVEKIKNTPVPVIILYNYY